VDEFPLLQFPHILRHCVGTHTHCPANRFAAGVALIGLAVFDVEQVTIDGDGCFSVVLHYADDTEERLPAVTPAEALMPPSLLHKKAPVSFFVLGEFLHRSLQMEDDGSASFLLKARWQILRILEEPIRTQVYLRNIFEMTFDGMERKRQRCL